MAGDHIEAKLILDLNVNIYKSCAGKYEKNLCNSGKDISDMTKKKHE